MSAESRLRRSHVYKLAILMFALCLLAASISFAKRSPPENVAPVRLDSLEVKVVRGSLVEYVT